MTRERQAILGLDRRLDKESTTTIPFGKFASLVSKSPRPHVRGIFQYFEDMILHFAKRLPEDDLKSLRNLTDNVYDPDSVFADGLDQPFFTDHFFMEDVLRLAHGLAQGQQNRFYIFSGDPGSGKSRLVNALLSRFEQYSRTKSGLRYETVWRFGAGNDAFDVPCPHHDNPLLIIPKERRREFLSELIEDRSEFEHISSGSGYSWLWTREACPVCDSIADALRRKEGFVKVLDAVHAKPYAFNRKTGQGISVYNPGDSVIIDEVLRDEDLEKRINAQFNGGPHIPYYHSRLAKTNDGILIIMDVQGSNVNRLRKLHSIISDEVHRAIDLEERTGSLFFVTLNPSEKERDIRQVEAIGSQLAGPPTRELLTALQGAEELRGQASQQHSEHDTPFLKEKSFIDRSRCITVPYLLDYKREHALYVSQFGDKALRQGFLPGIVTAFAKSIVSSRINNDRSVAVADALGESKEAYFQYCDPQYVLLRLELFAGVLPEWLAENDRKKFTKETLKRIRAEFPFDGRRGISGRDANESLSHLLGERDKLLEKNPNDRMGMIRLVSFIENTLLAKNEDRADLVKPEFLAALQRTYHYDIVQQINRSLFQLNASAIDDEVVDYLFRLSLRKDQCARSPFTGKEVIASEIEIAGIETRIGVPTAHREGYREAQRQSLAQLHWEFDALTREVLQEQAVFAKVRDAYVTNVRSNTLRTYSAIRSLRDAVDEYETDAFRSYPETVQKDVRRLLLLMQRGHKYTQPGAKQIVLYAIDNKLYLPENERQPTQST